MAGLDPAAEALGGNRTFRDVENEAARAGDYVPYRSGLAIKWYVQRFRPWGA